MFLSVQRILVKILFYGDDDATGVYITRTQQRAFAAQHAFVNLVFHFVQLSAQHQQVDASEREFGEASSRAGGRAGSARHAAVKSRFFCRQVVAQFF